MPETTITEEVTKTREHSIRVCDSCMHREWDAKNGLRIKDSDTRLYLCSVCTDELRENHGAAPRDVLRKREWLESEGEIGIPVVSSLRAIAALIVAMSVLHLLTYAVPLPLSWMLTFLYVFLGMMALLELKEAWDSDYPE